MALSALESAVLAKLLHGDHAVLVSLRQQLIGIAVKSRELTGVGFFTNLAVSSDHTSAPVTSRKIAFGDVQAEIPGLPLGAGFLLFVTDGKLEMLEGYTYQEPWPDSIVSFSLEYVAPDRSAELAKLG